MRVTVVISYYNARSVQPLIGLLESMQLYEAGCDYTTLIVVNREIDEDVILPEPFANHKILYRPNTGFNIGAWDYGWRSCPDADFFLFLQDDCLIYRNNWLQTFVRAGRNPRVGLLGESIIWNCKWSELIGTSYLEIIDNNHTLNGKPATKTEVYFDAFQRWNLSPGKYADHLQSLVWAARRDVLEAVNGFPISTNYGEAIAAEIATSKKIQSAGYRIHQVHFRPFYYIRHTQWPYQKSIASIVARRIRRYVDRNSLLYKRFFWLMDIYTQLEFTFSSMRLKGLFFEYQLRKEQANLSPYNSNSEVPRSESALYRVLFVDDNLPDPRSGAGYPRAETFLKELVEAGCRIDHYSLAHKSSEYLESFQKQHPELRFLPGSSLSGLHSLRLASSSAYDLVIVSRAITLNALIQTGWLHQESHKRPYRLVYDSEAITSVREQLRVQLYPLTLTERILSVLDPDEWSLARRADLITVVSDRDALMVQKNLNRPSQVVPYPVEIRNQVPEFHERRDFLFVGSLNIPFRKSPNVDGLWWFLSKVLPLIQLSHLPDFKVHIVGDVTSQELLSQSSDTVRFYGKVDDVIPYFDAARVFIAPVRFAAGIPIKVLDAISNGVPAVTSPLLRYQLGLDELYPETFPDPAAFARDCIRLYDDPHQWEFESDRQRTLAQTHYSPEVFRRSVRQLLETAKTYNVKQG